MPSRRAASDYLFVYFPRLSLVKYSKMRTFVIIVLINFYTIVNCQKNFCLLYSNPNPRLDSDDGGNGDQTERGCAVNGTLLSKVELTTLRSLCEKTKIADLASSMMAVKIRNNTVLDTFASFCDTQRGGQFAWTSWNLYNHLLNETDLVRTSNIYLIAKHSEDKSPLPVEDYCIFNLIWRRCQLIQNQTKKFDKDIDILIERIPIRYEIQNVTYVYRNASKPTYIDLDSTVVDWKPYFKKNYSEQFYFTLNRSFELHPKDVHLVFNVPVLFNETVSLDHDGKGFSTQNASKTATHFVDTEADFKINVKGRKTNYVIQLQGDLKQIFDDEDAASSPIIINGYEVNEEFHRETIQYLYVFKESGANVATISFGVFGAVIIIVVAICGFRYRRRLRRHQAAQA